VRYGGYDLQAYSTTREAVLYHPCNRRTLTNNIVYSQPPKAREGRAAMVTIGVVAGCIVAAGTIAKGISMLGKYIFNRGRKSAEEEARRAKIAEYLEDLRKRQSKEQ
jgi:hypothetical protein